MDINAPEGVLSKEELRFSFVFEQGFDRSCGFSAAASLLSLYWKQGLSEADLAYRYAPEKLDSGQLNLNFADLARICSDSGFSVKGVRMNWAQLGTALEKYAPIIIHYSHPDRHFVLALRSRGNWIITLDPALGCELQSREQFMERWSGAALLVWSPELQRDERKLAEALRVEDDRHELLERPRR
jgi:predicted double-glycine peptidase